MLEVIPWVPNPTSYTKSRARRRRPFDILHRLDHLSALFGLILEEIRDRLAPLVSVCPLPDPLYHFHDCEAEWCRGRCQPLALGLLVWLNEYRRNGVSARALMYLCQKPLTYANRLGLVVMRPFLKIGRMEDWRIKAGCMQYPLPLPRETAPLDLSRDPARRYDSGGRGMRPARVEIDTKQSGSPSSKHPLSILADFAERWLLGGCQPSVALRLLRTKYLIYWWPRRGSHSSLLTALPAVAVTGRVVRPVRPLGGACRRRDDHDPHADADAGTRMAAP